MYTTLVSFLALPLLATAHFILDYPPARGFDEDKLVTFPCATYPTSSNRTDWPLNAPGSIALTMGHDEALVQVLLGIGNEVGDAFNYILLPTVQEQGLGSFCIAGLVLPAGLTVTDGTNGTIQVVTNGDPSGGLYNCADITFRTNPLPPPPCQNNTGVTTTKNTSPFQNANRTSPNGSSTSSAAKSEADQTVVRKWILFFAAAVGVAALL